MRSLSSSIYECFCSIGYRRNYYYTDQIRPIPHYNLIVPVNKLSFELPTLALSEFLEAQNNNKKVDALIIPLKTRNSHTGYKTVDSSIREALNSNYHNTNLLTIKVPKEDTYYFCTNGAIFDKDLNILAMLFWEIEREVTVDPITLDVIPSFKFIKPILRVDSDVFINKSNTIERYIVNKLTSTALTTTCYIRGFHNIPNVIIPKDSHSIKVVIDRIPVIMQQVDAPSVSTTNKSILNVALDNLEEVMQDDD